MPTKVSAERNRRYVREHRARVKAMRDQNEAEVDRIMADVEISIEDNGFGGSRVNLTMTKDTEDQIAEIAAAMKPAMTFDELMRRSINRALASVEITERANRMMD